MKKLSLIMVSAVVALNICAQEKATKESHDLKVHQKLVVSLPANHTTGYSWCIKPSDLKKPVTDISRLDTDKLSIIKYSQEYVTDTPARPGAVGIGGHENWTFIADRPGVAEVVLEYVRPWDPKSVAQTKLFKFNVTK